MLTSLLAASLLAATPAARPCLPSDTLLLLHSRGQPFAEFLGEAESRKEQWAANYTAALTPDPALVARADMVSGRWRVLVVAVDSCSDSVHTIPWIAGLVEGLERIDLRVVLPEPGKAVMEAYRTPDGRAATPTILLLDDEGAVRGCIVERPRELIELLATPADSGQPQGTFQRKMAWYETNKGAAITHEFVAMIEAAERGERWCAVPAGGAE